MQTLEITKEIVGNNIIVSDRVRHLIMKRSLANPSIKLNEGMIKELQSIGFNWFVDGTFVELFSHASSIDEVNPTVSQKASCCLGLNIIYRGDIPDQVLANAMLVKKIGADCFSLHSNLPMPVEQHEHLVRKDPVMVGWFERPDIFSSPCDLIGVYSNKVDSKSCMRCKKDMGNRPMKFTCKSNDMLGVVVGIWDEDDILSSFSSVGI
jgi:hypothetical protein